MNHGSENSPGTRGSVLLVDDEAIVLRTLARLMEHAGYTVQAVSDPMAALGLARESSFSAIVTDVSMPVLGGLELLQELRSDGIKTPVILLSGAPCAGDIARAINLGAFRLVTKPFEFAEISEVLHRACGASDVTPHGHADVSSEQLDAALDSAWLVFQPLVDCDGNAFAWEALLRVSAKGFAGPQQVIDAAQRAERLTEIGNLVRRKAPDGLSAMPPNASVCVNVHPDEILDPGWLDDAVFGAYADRIILELTERARYDGLDGLSDRIRALKDRGFRIALDDLGAGYAGLGALSQLDADLVKLDAALTRDIDSNPTRHRLARSLIDLCRDLSLPVVAEGVESEAERDALVGMGVKYMQGYLFARPAHPPPNPKW